MKEGTAKWNNYSQPDQLKEKGMANSITRTPHVSLSTEILHGKRISPKQVQFDNLLLMKLMISLI